MSLFFLFIFLSFLFFIYIWLFPLPRLTRIAGGSWRCIWTFVAGLLVGVARRIMSRFILILIVLATMTFLIIIHTYNFKLNVGLEIVAPCIMKVLLLYGGIDFCSAIISWEQLALFTYQTTITAHGKDEIYLFILLYTWWRAKHTYTSLHHLLQIYNITCKIKITLFR